MTYIGVWILTVLVMYFSHYLIEAPCAGDILFTAAILAWGFVAHYTCANK